MTQITRALHGEDLNGLALRSADGALCFALTALGAETDVTAGNEHHLLGPFVAYDARVVFFFALRLRFGQLFDLLFLHDKRDQIQLTLHKRVI